MILLKYLIGFILAISSPAFEEGVDGWFPIEKPRKGVEREDEGDRSIWVLFSKSLGSEKIWVRFPDDPTYLEKEDGTFEFLSEKEGESFQLFVEQAGEREFPESDVIYSVEGGWVQEHFVQTEEHLYRFKSFLKDPQSPNHKAFISSFSIEKSS